MPGSILIVDDSATVRKFTSVSLSMQGFKVVTANDGMDALEKLPRERFDLIITDLNMPNMDGFELVRSLRENSEYAEIPIIILSSLADEISKAQSIECGANSYLTKPFSTGKIQNEVSKYLRWTDD